MRDGDQHCSLPGLQGDELARRLRKIQPSLPIVLSTGLSTNEIATDLIDDVGVLVLEKPYPLASLTECLQKLGLRIPTDISSVRVSACDERHRTEENLLRSTFSSSIQLLLTRRGRPLQFRGPFRMFPLFE